MGTLDRMLKGENLIRPLSDSMRQEMVDKNVVRLEKASGDFTRLQELSDVIQLAAYAGDLDIVETYGIDSTFDDALDRVSRITIAAGIEAMRDAGLPLVRHYRTTSTGKKLPDRWGLPDGLSRRTGVIVGTAFGALDRVIEDVSQHVASKHAGRTGDELAALIDRISEGLKDPTERAATRELAKPLLEGLRGEAEVYQFSRKFLFRVLAMAHAQLAQVIAARGPNALVNAACASGTLALALADDWLRLDRCDRVIVVGADDVTHPTNLPYIGAGFLAAGAATTEKDVERAAVPFGTERNGLILGSGAAGFVLEREDAARARGFEPVAELVSSQSSNSAFHGTRLDTKRIAKDVRDFVDEVLEAEGLG
ncbi:MAG: beta-ketoacyl synthase N-terminal-like domain-containing protein, partial [Myxococcota bacterium]